MNELFAYIEGRKCFLGRNENFIVAQVRADRISQKNPGVEVVIENEYGVEIYTSGIHHVH